MSYSLDEIKSDLHEFDNRQFYLKHIVRSDNWYFENVLGYPKSELQKISDDFRMTISESMGISFNSIMIVGSGKIGYSLSPTDKLFSPFSVDGEMRNNHAMSDIDVAIISSDLFEQYWKLFRSSYTIQASSYYKAVYCEIYRGYINEKNILSVDGCRKAWLDLTTESKKLLVNKLFIKHEVTYRIYRSWEDFEEYNLKNIEKIRMICQEATNG